MEVFQREFPPNTKILKITHISNRSIYLYPFLPLRAGDAGAGGCYTIPMGLCYGKRDSGHDARIGTNAPGRLSPLGVGGMGGCKSVADLLRHSLAHRFSLKSAGAGGAGQSCVRAAVSLWRLTENRQSAQSHCEGWQWRLLVWPFGAQRCGEPN